MQNRRKLLFLLLALLGTTSLHARADDPAVTVYGVEIPPYILGTPNGNSGIVVDIAREAFRRAGYRARFELLPWARAISLMREGVGDAVIPTQWTAERTGFLNFPENPVFEFEMSLFRGTGSGADFSGQMETLRGRSLVKLRGASFTPEFDAAGRSGLLRTEEADSFAGCLRMLTRKRADFAGLPRLTGIQLIYRDGLTKVVEAIEPPVSVQKVYIAFARHERTAVMQARVDAALGRMWNDGSIAEIVAGYRKRRYLPPTAPLPAQ